jgi:Plastocyanin
MRQQLFLTGSIIMTFALAACGGEATNGGNERAREGAPSSDAVASTTPATDGDTIVVELHTDETGNYFKPAEIEAEQGDVIRFTLMTGVHNVHFLPDSNPGKTGLPPASEMLQLPGQTVDIPVTMAHGKYYFQCDPHAALGMVGRLEVED